MSKKNSNFFVNVERVPLRLFSATIIICITLLSIITVFVISHHSRVAATDMQKKSLSRVIAISADGVLVNINEQLLEIGTSILERLEEQLSIKRFPLNFAKKDQQKLISELNDPLINQGKIIKIIYCSGP